MTNALHVIPFHRSLQPELETTGSKPPPEWPTRGEIVFENVVMRYRSDLPPAVNGLSFRIAAGNHVGVCGRTGAGKSSLSVAMFRMRELTSGRITVDGIDLAGLGLADVRSRALFIVPQQAVLFSGTIRFNLDPFMEYTNAQCLAALERARMAQYVSEVGGLESVVDEGGSNYSQGQRQLLCLARAVLREPRVLVLDEATSSVDFETDKHIQAIIRDVFSNTTVIEIAHRLQSIMDCDQIMVLDQGKLAEMNSPANLLKTTSMFASLVDSTGPAMRSALRAMVLSDEAAEEE
jgi:ATP-binding cassette subfamily C (CFTR/MRP) protein 1